MNGFEFSVREYTDKRRPDGKMNRYWNPEWLHTYKFLVYSKQEDEVYCLSCILSPTQPKNGSCAAKLITAPCTNGRKIQTIY